MVIGDLFSLLVNELGGGEGLILEMFILFLWAGLSFWLVGLLKTFSLGLLKLLEKSFKILNLESSSSPSD